MTVEQSRPRVEPAPLAAAARSILACPGDVQLVVDGVDDITLGLDEGEGTLDMRDEDGRPVFTCPRDAALAVAATEGRGALLTIASGLGRPGSPDRDATVTLAGKLETTGVEECHCCDRVRAAVALRLDYVLLSRAELPGTEGVQLRVPLGEFHSPDHLLNRGFLQRSTEHANRCHQDELRRAVSAASNTRLGDIVGVHLADLRPDRVEVQWVDHAGAHSTLLAFGRAATSPGDLGELLRTELHAGLC